LNERVTPIAGSGSSSQSLLAFNLFFFHSQPVVKCSKQAPPRVQPHQVASLTLLGALVFFRTY